jgi:rare lipoprotein A
MGVLVLALGACSSGPDGRRIGSQPPVQGGYKVGVPYQIRGVWYYPKEDFNYNRTGIASWYGHPFHGRTSASGERYDMGAMTAAHKTLPMPSLVEVTNLDNGRRAVLRINDRGPFVSGRIIDVSRAAAGKLGFKGAGVARVRVRILKRESRRMKQLALANMTSRARAVAARRQRRAAAGPQLTTRPVERRPTERYANERRPVTSASRKGGGQPPVARVQPIRRAPSVTPGGAGRVAATRTGRGQGAIRVTELPPTGATGGTAAAGRPVGPVRGAARPPAAAGPGRIAGRPVEAARPRASAIRAARPGTPRIRARSRELPGQIYVQAGAFRDQINANRLRGRLAALGIVRVVPVRAGARRYFRVRVGPVATASQGNRLLARVVDAGYPRAQIVID